MSNKTQSAHFAPRPRRSQDCHCLNFQSPNPSQAVTHGYLYGQLAPLSKSMMEDSPECRKLTPGEKVLRLSILSQLNYRGDFYKADIEWAVELDLSLSKVRQARRKFQSLGWLSATPGWKAKGGRLATTYHYARWAKPGKGVFFARMRRYTWEWFLVGPRLGAPRSPADRLFLSHADLLLYAYLCYFWRKFGGVSPGE